MTARKRSDVADTDETGADDASADDASTAGAGVNVADVVASVPGTDPGDVSLMDDSAAANAVTDDNATDEGAAAALDRVLSHAEAQGEVYEGAIADMMLVRSILRRALKAKEDGAA